MNEYTTKNRKTNSNDEDPKGNQIDQKYMTCTHIDKEWGKDFAGTTEPVALCTPPWHILREALFGIVQSMKEDDENNHNKERHDDESRPPVDIAYVVVVNAAARVKKTPRRRSMLPASIMAKYENRPDHTTTATGLRNDPVALDQADKMSTLSCDPPKYKLVIDDDDDDDNENHIDVDNDKDANHLPMVETTTNTKCPPILENFLPTDTMTPFASATNRPTFRLCLE